MTTFVGCHENVSLAVAKTPELVTKACSKKLVSDRQSVPKWGLFLTAYYWCPCFIFSGIDRVELP
jgi:hypothetical protein